MIGEEGLLLYATDSHTPGALGKHSNPIDPSFAHSAQPTYFMGLIHLSSLPLFAVIWDTQG
jgi:hypothetical protein